MIHIELSIIIAVYSEEISLVKTVERLLQRNRGYIKEIILAVSPFSSEACLQTCRNLSKRWPLIRIHIQKNNPGQGWAFREGIGLACGSHIVIMSADLETDPETVDRMVRKIEKDKCDIVTANRWIPGGGFEGYGLIKLICNFIFQRTCMILFNTNISDLTFGFRAFESHLAKDMIWECRFHDFCLESILKPIRLGKYIEEIPARWRRRREGRSRSGFMGYIRYCTVVLRVFFMKRSDFLPSESA